MSAHNVTERNVRNRVLVYAPLGFLAVGLALSGISASSDGAPGPVVVGVGLALLAAYWLGRRSKVENTALAVAAAVSVARAEATSAALAQAHQQVAVIVGPDRAHELINATQNHELAHSGPITSIRDGRPTEEDGATRQRVLESWPFAGAERVPEPQINERVAASDGGGRLARRGDDPGDPLAALQHAQTPPQGGYRVT